MLRFALYYLLKFPLKLLLRCKVISSNSKLGSNQDGLQPILYVLRNQSASDVIALQYACLELNLPDPLSKVMINGCLHSRLFFIEKPSSLLPWKSNAKNQAKTKAITQGLQILTQHQKNQQLNALLMPINITWGRTPTKENNKKGIASLIAEQASPNWLRKFFMVLLFGRQTLIRFSEPLSFREIADRYGFDKTAAHKLLRIARIHFYRQTIAATGPRLMQRKQIYQHLLNNDTILKTIQDEAHNKGRSQQEIEKHAQGIINEIVSDYSDNMIHFGERLLKKLWDRLYQQIIINNADVVRQVAQDGHEIIYLPCHRSHMDYLLLTYVIYHQGLVTPRIAAGINLNFWPVGTIFRKAGAFFIRRSFKGDRLYSTIFREYLRLLFQRGYAVKYYTEGGRSRTGRLLPPKTGLLAMTLQSLLRDIHRPVTIIPVYIGYEHVMEVSTYHKELSGNSKKKESLFGVFKAIKNLRNYGNGYVNFGQPININQFLNQQVPNWKASISAQEQPKPAWLTPTVNNLADNVMRSINQSAALNAVSLIALILHSTDKKALLKTALIEQLSLFTSLQQYAPYSKSISLPQQSSNDQVEHVLSLNKVKNYHNAMGDIIGLTDTTTIEMRYYRNNILHTYLLPAFICRLLVHLEKISHDEMLKYCQCFMTLFRDEYFLWQTPADIAAQFSKVMQYFTKENIVKQSKAGYWSLNQKNDCIKLNILAQCITEHIERLAIISQLLFQYSSITQDELAARCHAVVERLSLLNDSETAQLEDKTSHAMLIETLQKQGYLIEKEHGLLTPTNQLIELKELLESLISVKVLQSITG